MSKLHVEYNIDLDTVDGRYLISCARIRDVAVATLMHRLVSEIAREQLVLAVLDDDSKFVRRKGDHRFKEMA